MAAGARHARRRNRPSLRSARAAILPCLALAFALAVSDWALGTSAAYSPQVAAPSRPPAPSLLPDDASVRQLSPALRQQLIADPYAFFRFVNQPWLRAVCAAFAGVESGAPVVRLHGDPHLEQYAFTADSRGLDDFDDSASGPFVVDLVRFLASVRLATDARGWQTDTGRAMNAFFEAYRASLGDSEYLPPDPAVIARMRATRPTSAAAFLVWADSLMQPLDSTSEAALPAARDALEAYARRANPAMPGGYFDLKRAGLLRMGVGSALATKLLLRLEGPTSDPDDDVIVEAKRAGDLGGIPCLEVTRSPAFRVVSGAEQIGRLRHELLFVMPRINPERRDLPERWWIRSWDRTYHEVDISDYATPGELVEVARDVGAQLGHGHFHNPKLPMHTADRDSIARAVTRFEPRVRQQVDRLTSQLLTDWAEFKRRARQ